VDDVDRFLSTHAIDTIEVSLPDLTGALRGKRVPVSAFSGSSGPRDTAFSSGLFIWDYAADLVADEQYNWSNGYPDIQARPDLSTMRRVSWRPGTALVLCDAFLPSGEPVDIAPRQVLRRAVDALREAGYRAQIGLETEFFLLDAQSLTPSSTRNPVYSLHDGWSEQPIVDEIVAALIAAGIEVESYGLEYAAGQVEINTRYADPLQAADQLMFFRYTVKQIAARHGRIATFMAKPFDAFSGSGLHIHQSLCDLDGRNVFWDAERRDLSVTARHYLSGLLRYLTELHAVYVPTPNGYKRMSDRSFAPTTVSWGLDNRCVAVRGLVHGSTGSRLELRVAAADANPYLAVAAAIMSGLSGIVARSPPPPPVASDAYATADLPRLPGRLCDATASFRTSGFARTVFGSRMVDLIATVAEREVGLFDSAVSDWERARYLQAV
jgi:glutamine synthetase